MATALFGNNTAHTMNYPGCQDCDITDEAPLENSGASQTLIVGDYRGPEAECYSTLIAFDLASFFADHPDATITSAQLKIYCVARVA